MEDRTLGSQKKVSRACQRCRRQKLRCDVQRPCMLCIRAGADCISSAAPSWKVYAPSKADPDSERPAKRARTSSPDATSPAECQLREAHQVSQANGQDSSDLRTIESEGNNLLNNHVLEVVNGSEQLRNSSSTMSLIDEAFRLHNATTPRDPITNAIPGGQQRKVRHIGSDNVDQPIAGGGLTTRLTGGLPWIKRSLASSPIVAELTSLFPPYEAATLLVDTYFDRVHWFMLLFHQDEFRRRWPQLYQRRRRGLAQGAIRQDDIGFISTFLMVIVIGLQYIGVHRQNLLSAHNVDRMSLQIRIFAAIRTHLLDIVSLNSLEAAQTCILLGTYYLFHGDPGLAWPVCGCALRIAQALDLHRKQHHPDENAGRPPSAWRNQNESRKRCWWAIYEIETFCSMSYGYPHGIKDTDCDVEPLDPSVKLQGVVQSPSSFNEPLRCETTLLSYKYFMSKLSVITKEALAELYCIGPASVDRVNESLKSRPYHLVQKAALFDRKLHQWMAEIPTQLRVQRVVPPGNGFASIDELDREIGTSGPRFESHIFQLQALTLQIAYENAKILVHRPLLSYRLVTNSPMTPSSKDYLDDPFRLSMQACRDAALRTSELMSAPVVDFIADTYAAAFVGIHTFTAGITLGILSSIEPLSPQSYEAKVGLQRLMAIQAKLKSRSPLSAQGLEILQRLTKHVMEKELNAMLNVSQQPTMAIANQQANQQANRSGDAENLDNAPSINPVPQSLNLLTGRDYCSPAAPHTVVSTSPMSPIVDSGDSGGISSSTTLDDTMAFQYVQDTALSQAVADFDKVISTQAPSYSSGFEEAPEYHWGLSGDDGFPALEQAWIWGLDNFPPE